MQETDIPVKMLKENAEHFAEYICLQFKEAICTSKFPAPFKFANIISAFKPGSRNQKENYMPIIISKIQCGFRKGYSPQHFLLLMIDKWKKAVDNNEVFGAILTDLSKAFDCICHDLLVAKLNAYGLSRPALKMIQDYLLNPKHRTKIGSSYRSWEDITSGIPQGSILGPLLFNIFLCDQFHEYQNNYFANYADDTTPCMLMTILQKH